MIGRLDILPKDEQRKYLRHLDNLHYSASMAMTLKLEAEDRAKEAGRKKGIEEEIKEGIKERNVEIAKRMKEKSIDVALIVELTGLTKEEINKL